MSEKAIFIHSKLIFSAYKLYEECVGGTDQAKKTVINKLDSKISRDQNKLLHLTPFFQPCGRKKSLLYLPLSQQKIALV